MSFSELKTQMESRIQKTIEVLKKDLSGLRTGRASTSLLDTVVVDAYGSMLPLNQVGSVSVLEARLLGVQVWDKNMVKAVEKAITNAGLGLNPMSDGALIRIPIPALNEERRLEMIKVGGKFAETARVSVRNIRRDALDELKAQEKASEISEDDLKRYEGEVQKVIDAAIKYIDDILKTKEAEIKQV